ncbi:MAG: FAD-binding protein [Hypericibacter sp.]
MRETDAIVIGAELEALLATLRLLQQGASVRLLATGGGSLPYAPGGLQLLGRDPQDPVRAIANPFEAVERLPLQHPLRHVGRERIGPALDWFLDLMERLGAAWQREPQNRPVIAMAGETRSVLARPQSQASLDTLTGHRIAVLAFERFRDFPADLIVAGLRRQGLDAITVRVDPKLDCPDSVRFGQALDRPGEAAALLETVRKALPAGRDLVLFPAILGIARHRQIFDLARQVLDAPVFEGATLPPCLFGVRLHHLLMREISRLGGLVQPGMRSLRGLIEAGRCQGIGDGEGRHHRASHYIAGSGGVLMGGLEVDSRGHIAETIFGLPIHQTDPLGRRSPAETIDALHRAGVETDSSFRPTGGDGAVVENLRVIGATLAHWNPTLEESSEGVAIGTAWAATGNAAGASH